MESILNYWPSEGFLITDHGVWLRSIWSLSICISSFPDILKLALVISIREIIILINCPVSFNILTIPFVLRSSHCIMSDSTFADCLRLPFLCNRLWLSTSILDISWRKFDGVLVPWLAWNTDCLHLSNGIWIQGCWCIFHVLLIIAIWIIFHGDNYTI